MSSLTIETQNFIALKYWVLSENVRKKRYAGNVERSFSNPPDTFCPNNLTFLLNFKTKSLVERNLKKAPQKVTLATSNDVLITLPNCFCQKSEIVPDQILKKAKTLLSPE